MKLVFTVDEMVGFALIELAKRHPSLEMGKAEFTSDHGSMNGGVGKAYDVPDFLEVEVTPKP